MILKEDLIDANSTPGDEIFQAWKVPYKKLFYLRWIACSYGLFGVLYMWWLEWPLIGKQLFFMTIWGHDLTFIYFILMLVYMSKYESKEKRETQGHVLLKFITLMSQIVFSLECVIMIFFWSVLAADIMKTNAARPFPLNVEFIFLNVILHAVSPLCIILEVVFNKIPFDRRKGAIAVTVVMAVYSVWNFIGTKVLGKPIYKPIDWSSPLTVVFLLIAYALGMAAFFSGHWLQKRKLENEKGHDVLPEDSLTSV